MGDKYVSNALMMSTKNNLYELVPFIYCYLMKATIVFCKFITPLSLRVHDEDITIYQVRHIMVDVLK